VIEIAIGLLGGWLISHLYYRKSNNEVPQWARPLIERFPIVPPSLAELTDLYHQAVIDGDIVPHPSGFIKCPECDADAGKFEPWQVADHETETLYHGYRCSECNYELSHEED
jgi:hypothetical protein